MKYSLSFSALALASSAMAAYVPSEPWTTLTPEGLAAGAVTDYSNSFGIAIHTITTEVNVKAKREIATQIGDGQVQGTTSTGEETIAPTTKATVAPTTDSTEAPETTKATVAPTTHSTEAPETTKATVVPTTESTEAPKTEKTTSKLSPSSVSFSGASHPDIVVTQIGDGQVQVANPTPTYIEIPTETTETTAGKTTVVSTTSKASYSSSSSYSYRSYSQVPSSSASSAGPVATEATCKSSGDLAMTLKASVLTDAKGRIGAIVSNRQFQFDGPPPQAGSIYAAGWGIVDGHLTLGEDQIFWECLSGTFYNLYDQSLGDQCVPVYLNVVDLLDC